MKKTLLFLSVISMMFYTCTDLEETLEDELTTEFSDDGVPDVSGETAGGVFPSGALAAAYGRLRNGSAGLLESGPSPESPLCFNAIINLPVLRLYPPSSTTSR